MADRPRFPGTTHGNPAIDGEVLPPPIDPERFRHIQLPKLTRMKGAPV